MISSTMPSAKYSCRAPPKDATYGSPGVGTPPHFIGAQLARADGFEYTHVPYRGNLAAKQDLLAGQIASAMLTIDSAPLSIVREHSSAGNDGASTKCSSPRRTNIQGIWIPNAGEIGFVGNLPPSRNAPDD
jgi:tripartite-type tricarboxylate transporter receptor subunit TctC